MASQPVHSFVSVLDEIQRPITALLKPTGFKKFGRTYNRTTQGLLTHVINIQSGPSASSLHGQFTINIGVFVPCIYKIEWDSEIKKTIQEYNCHINYRIGMLAKYDSDQWWSLSDPPFESAKTVIDDLSLYCLPLLDRLIDNNSVLNFYHGNKGFPGTTEAKGVIYAAILNSQLGKLEESKKLFDLAISMARDLRNDAFENWISGIITKCGNPAT